MEEKSLEESADYTCVDNMWVCDRKDGCDNGVNTYSYDMVVKDKNCYLWRTGDKFGEEAKDYESHLGFARCKKDLCACGEKRCARGNYCMDGVCRRYFCSVGNDDNEVTIYLYNYSDRFYRYEDYAFLFKDVLKLEEKEDKIDFLINNFLFYDFQKQKYRELFDETYIGPLLCGGPSFGNFDYEPSRDYRGYAIVFGMVYHDVEEGPDLVQYPCYGFICDKAEGCKCGGKKCERFMLCADGCLSVGERMRRLGN